MGYDCFAFAFVSVIAPSLAYRATALQLFQRLLRHAVKQLHIASANAKL